MLLTDEEAGHGRDADALRTLARPRSTRSGPVFEGSDACVTPVLTFAEAARHPHVAARRTLVDVGGVVQPGRRRASPARRRRRPARRSGGARTPMRCSPSWARPGGDRGLEAGWRRRLTTQSTQRRR